MRASSLSNPKVIQLLNAHFLPVYVDSTYLPANAETEADELAAYRQLFGELNSANERRRKSGQKLLSIGTVHAYVFTPDGRALDARHVTHAGPASVIEMLEAAVQTFKTPAGKPIVTPSSQSPRPDCDADALALHLTARYLVPRGSSEARRDVAGELVPLNANLGGERSGQWSALPSEDWFVLKRKEWTRLLPNARVAVGDSWQVDPSVAETLLTRFYPTTEQNDLSKNRLDERSLKLTAFSVEKNRVRARIDGRLKMKHSFYPGRDDDNFVNATIVGLIEFDPVKPQIHSLQIATDGATYGIQGKRLQPFGVAVQIVSEDFGSTDEPDARSDGDSATLEIKTRRREKVDGAKDQFRVVERTSAWQPTKSAIVIVDMWDSHHCKSAAARVVEMAPHVNRTITAARDKGVFIIHAPSDCMKYYKDAPQRRRAVEAPLARSAVTFQWNYFNTKHEGPLAERLEKGGCSCDTPEPCSPSRIVWERQIDTITVHPSDAITSDGQQVFNLLQQRGIDNVVVIGVHTNRCVLGRPFGIRQMVYLRKNVVLCRDLTDSYHRDPGHHFEGLDQIIGHVEKYWCPTITSESLTGQPPFQFRRPEK